MAKTFGCQDVEDNDCPWRMNVADGEEDLIVSATLQHANTYHPEFAASTNPDEVIRSKIADLLQQSHYFDNRVEASS